MTHKLQDLQWHLALELVMVKQQLSEEQIGYYAASFVLGIHKVTISLFNNQVSQVYFNTYKNIFPRFSSKDLNKNKLLLDLNSLKTLLCWIDCSSEK